MFSKELSGHGLIEFMKTLPDYRRDTVLAQALKWDLLKRFLDRPEGKIIVNHIVDKISDRLGDLMKAVMSDDEKAMRRCVHELKAYESVMHELATIAEDGMSIEGEIT